MLFDFLQRSDHQEEITGHNLDLTMIQQHQFWNFIFQPPSLSISSCELATLRPSRFFKAFQVLKVSAPPCFHFFSCSDCIPQLSTSTFSLANYPFSIFFLSFLHLTLPPGLMNHLFSLLLKGKAKFWGEWSTAVPPGQILAFQLQCHPQESFNSLTVLLHTPLITNFTIFFQAPPNPDYHFIWHPCPYWSSACQLSNSNTVTLILLIHENNVSLLPKASSYM